ncbi:MAG: hypothetical protein QOE60_2979 [Thermoleophilaceae bacterium]|nr:hypothetical protein [Thermoleophilaceae bacterium]
MFAYSQSSQPSRSAASSASAIAAAWPFMNTLRASLRAAAAPGSAPTTVTGIPSRSKAAANRSAPLPDASAGVRTPQSGTGSIRARSTKAVPSTAAATARLSAGAAVFRSAYTQSGASAGATASATSSATAAEFTLRTILASPAASAAWGWDSTPSGAGCSGSKPSTRLPAATRSAAIAEPASPRPSTAIAGGAVTLPPAAAP